MSSATSKLNTILRAGAGAGKTTRLTEEFLNFALSFKKENQKFPRIVVTTFTRKATQELKERLLTKALENEDSELFHFVSSKSQVQISTIHGVLSVFLSRYGAEIGLTPDYKIMSESEIRKNARKIIRKHLLEDAQLQELLEEYDFATIENCLLEYFSQSVIHPHMSMATTEYFETENSKVFAETAGEMKRIAFEIRQTTIDEKWQNYTDQLLGFSWKMSTEGWSDFFCRLENFWSELSKPIFRKTPQAPFSLTLNEELENLRKKIDKLIEKPRYRPEFWERHERNCLLFKKLADFFCFDFMKMKLENGLLSMSDLEILAIKMIREQPETAQKFSLEWDFWMVDEYQDTSPVQVELLKSLIGEKASFVVGDPQQSIYLFRGARSEVFQQKVDEVAAEKGNVETKLVNYRSTPEVLEFFNFYFTRLGSQFAAMTPAPDKVRAGNAEPVAQVLIVETTEGDGVSAEITSTVARIQELLLQGVAPEQIAVLGRTHRTLEEIAKMAQTFGVPIQLHSGSGFYERREVLDALALLKFLVNPHDNINLVALLRSPWLVLSDSEILKFCHGSKHSYWREAQNQMNDLGESHPLQMLKKYLQISEEKGLSWTLKMALVELGYLDYSFKIDSTGRREANLWKVVSLLAQSERRPGFNFLDFLDASLETLSTDEGGEDVDATPVIEPKRVNLMTVHASKGLQFEQVILPGMGRDPRMSHSPLLSVREEDGKWSLKIRDDETQGMVDSLLAEEIMEALRLRETAEYNRVLYVALTRAKSGVTLIWDKSKIGKKSWASLCPLDTEEGLHSEENFSYLVRVGNSLPQKMSAETFAEKDLRPLWQAPELEFKRRSLSVTELVAPEALSGSGYTVKPTQLGVSLATAQQGTNAHRMFEALKYTDFDRLIEIAEPELTQPLLFIRDYQKAPILAIIENGFVEWGFSLVYEDKLIQGQIDLWGIVEGTLWMVDYKTGSQKYSETAFKQLEVYAWALQKMGYLESVENIQLAVVYPLDEVVKVESVGNVTQLTKKIEKLMEQSLQI